MKLDLALLGNFYFRDAHRLAVRERLIEVLDAYQAIVGPNLRHWFCILGDGRSSGWKKWQPGNVAKIRSSLFETVDQIFSMEIRGGDNAGEASDFFFQAIGNADWEQQKFGRPSYLQILLPWKWYATHQGNFPDLFTFVASKLRPMHGFGGLGFAYSNGSDSQYEMAKTVFTLAQAIPALIVDGNYSESQDLGHAIREGNFLTALDDDYVARLGGAGAIAAALGEGFTIRTFEGGLTIQAGEEPNPVGPSIYQPAAESLPDAPSSSASPALEHAAALYPLYHRLNRVLKPIRVSPELYKFGLQSNRYEKTDYFDQARTEAWMARFD